MPEVVTLLAALDDPEVSVRVLALRLVAGLEVDDAAPKLTALLGDAADDVRVHAALGLARLDAWEVVPQLLPLLRDSSPDVRANVADALSALKDERAMPALISALEDPSPVVARAAHERAGWLLAWRNGRRDERHGRRGRRLSAPASTCSEGTSRARCMVGPWSSRDG